MLPLLPTEGRQPTGGMARTTFRNTTIRESRPLRICPEMANLFRRDCNVHLFGPLVSNCASVV